MQNDEFELDYLKQPPPAQAVGTVKLNGKSYTLRRADVLKDFIITLASISRQIVAVENAKLDDAQSLADFANEYGEKLLDLRDEMHSCVQRLVPDLPREVLVLDFPSIEATQALFNKLLELISERAPEALKKNCDGENTKKRSRKKRSQPANDAHSCG